jgi:hypothetical protein
MEVDFRQQLSFLPGALKGLAVRANYTNVRTTAVFDGLSYGRGQVVGSAGQWYIPRVYNVGLTYVYGNFGSNFDVNYTSQFPVVFGLTTPGSNRYRFARTTMNAGVSYKIRPDATLFLNVSNLDEEQIEYFTAMESRHRQFNIVPRAVKFGVTGRF